MNSKNCINCYYYDVCHSIDICDDFVPITDDADNAFIDEMVELGRKDFLSEWNLYITQLDD